MTHPYRTPTVPPPSPGQFGYVMGLAWLAAIGAAFVFGIAVGVAICGVVG